MRGPAIGMLASVELPREPDQDHPADGRRQAIDRAGKAEPPGQQRNRQKNDAINEDLPRRRGPSDNNREHGEAGPAIFVRTMMIRNRTSGASSMSPVAAAQPITGGSAPAAPPMTMFWGVSRLSHIVYTTTEKRIEKESSAAACTPAAMPRTAMAPQARTSPNASASPREIVPRGIGRSAVRVITASMSASYHILSTPEAPAPAALARIAANPSSGSSRPGAIISPTNAVNTASSMTRGFMSARNSGTRVVEREREGNCV